MSAPEIARADLPEWLLLCITPAQRKLSRRELWRKALTLHGSLSSAELAVLHALSCYMDADGRDAFPSLSVIAHGSGMQRRSVMRVLARVSFADDEQRPPGAWLRKISGSRTSASRYTAVFAEIPPAEIPKQMLPTAERAERLARLQELRKSVAVDNGDGWGHRVPTWGHRVPTVGTQGPQGRDTGSPVVSSSCPSSHMEPSESAGATSSQDLPQQSQESAEMAHDLSSDSSEIAATDSTQMDAHELGTDELHELGTDELQLGTDELQVGAQRTYSARAAESRSESVEHAAEPSTPDELAERRAARLNGDDLPRAQRWQYMMLLKALEVQSEKVGLAGAYEIIAANQPRDLALVKLAADALHDYRPELLEPSADEDEKSA